MRKGSKLRTLVVVNETPNLAELLEPLGRSPYCSVVAFTTISRRCRRGS